MSDKNGAAKKSPSHVIDSPENQVRIAKFKERADAEERKIAETSRIFDPVALIQRAGQIHEINHPDLGLLRFGELTLADSILLRKCKTDEDKTAMSIYLMLKKAYPNMPDYTPETIHGFYEVFPLIEGAALLKMMQGEPSFLPQNSTNGSTATSQPKT